MQEEFVPSALVRGCFAAGVVARVESLRQVEGLFECLLAEAFEQ